MLMETIRAKQLLGLLGLFAGAQPLLGHVSLFAWAGNANGEISAQTTFGPFGPVRMGWQC